MPDIENFDIFKSKYDRDAIDEALGRALSNVYMEQAVEGYFHDGQFYADAAHTELIPPQAGVLYMDISYDPAFGYRWGGSQYCGVTTSEIFITEEARREAELRREEAELARQEAERDRTTADAQRSVVGAWSPEEYYYVGNRATIDGSCYECIQNNINHDPRDSTNNYAFWFMIASAGDSGDGSGDMTKNVYDPQNKRRDIFEYTDSKMRPYDRAVMLQTATGKYQKYQFSAKQTDSAEMFSIAFGNGVFRALGRWNNPYAASQYSYDGMEWFKDGAVKDWGAAGNILYGKNRFVGFFSNRNGGFLVLMDGAQGWTDTIIENGVRITSNHRNTALPDWGNNTAVFDGDKFVFIAAAGYNSTTKATYFSENGLYYEKGGDLPVSKRWCYLRTAIIDGSAHSWAVSYDGDVAVTTDHGLTWTALPAIPKSSGKYIYCMEYVPSGNSGKLVAAGNDNAIYISSDMGQTWVKKVLQQSDMYIRAIPHAFNNIYLPFGGSIKKSSDFFETWSDTGVSLDLRAWTVGNGKLVITALSSTIFTADGNNFIASGGSYLSDQAGTPVTDAVAGALGATRTAILTYVGIGTYGQDNPCSITADYPIKAAICMGNVSGGYMDNNALTTTFAAGVGFSNGGTPYGKRSSDGKTFTWYGNSAAAQLNSAGTTYRFLVFM